MVAMTLALTRGGKMQFSGYFKFVLAALAGAAFAACSLENASAKPKLRVIHSFCAVGGTSCTDGSNPNAGLLADSSGNLVGTAGSGGAHGSGVVFELTANPEHTKWKYQILYDFCAKASCADGQYP